MNEEQGPLTDNNNNRCGQITIKQEPGAPPCELPPAHTPPLGDTSSPSAERASRQLFGKCVSMMEEGEEGEGEDPLLMGGGTHLLQCSKEKPKRVSHWGYCLSTPQPSSR